MNDEPLITASQILDDYRSGRQTPLDVMSDIFRRIKVRNRTVNAFASLNEEEAMSAARESTQRWNSGHSFGQLDGLPISPKDSMIIAGQATRSGSATTPNSPEPEDSPYIARLRHLGAIMVGRTATPEFCWTGATNSPLNGMTRNPWDTSRTVGGSSGGAAAAVAAGMVPIALGTDAGGSIRTPAGLCGVVGFKPSFGRIKLHLKEGYSTFSSAGPLANTVGDVRLIFGAMDRKEVASQRRISGSFPLSGLRVAVTTDMGYARYVAPEIVDGINRVAAHCSALGARVVEKHPPLRWPIDTYNAIGWAEQAHNLSSIVATDRSVMDPGLVEIVGVGERITTAQYIQAQKDRWELCRIVETFFEQIDVLLTPTLPVTAFHAGLLAPDGDAVTAMNDWLPFSSIFNMTGQPCISVPCGFDSAGLPFGAQLVGRPGDDWVILDVAETVEVAAGWREDTLKRARLRNI